MTPSLTLARRILSTASACLLATPAFGVIIGSEGFDYPDGPIAGKTGGTFWDYKNFAPAAHIGTPSNWDNFSGAPAVTSGRLVTNGSSAKREYNGTLESDGAVNDPASVPSSVAKSVYYRVTLTTGATVPDFFGISSQDFGDEKLFFGKRSGQPKFGIDETGVGGTDSTTTPNILPNTTYTLVARIDYNANLVRLFVNPDLNAPEESQLTAASRSYTGTNWSTAVRLASGSGSPLAWDDLVVATTWDDLGTVVDTTTDEDNGSLTGNSSISLREAVKYSPAGTLIDFLPGLSGQTITLTHADGDLLIDRALTIDATSLPRGIILNGGNAQRIMTNVATGPVKLIGLTFTGGNGVSPNSNTNAGAFFASDFTKTEISRCTFFGNTVGSNGGALMNLGIMTLTNSVFYDNRASSQGGALQNEEILTMIGCTLTGNTAGSYGGAIESQDTLTIRHSTICFNTASTAGGGGGGGIDIYNSPATLENSIVWGNTNPVAPEDIRLEGTTFNRLGANIVGQVAQLAAVTQTGPLPASVDPKLTPLGHFGGPVMTMHPLIGSPAIDTGGTTDPGGTDARGFPRFINGDSSSPGSQLDLGAVEAGRLLFVSAAGDGAGFTLRAHMASAPSFGLGTRIGFSSALFPGTIPLASELIPTAGSALFIDASNIPGPVILSGNNASRLFNVPAGATLALHSLNLTGGRAPDGSFEAAGGSGGGIFNSGTLSLLHSTLHGNRAGNGGLGDLGGAGGGGDGGALANSGIARIVSSTFSGNRAGDGGFSFDDSGNAGVGGAIRNTGSLTLVSSTVSANRAGDGGPGSGRAGGTGGGISASGGTLHLAHSVISGNQPGSGTGGDDDGFAPDLSQFDPPLITTGANFIGTTTGIFTPITGPAPLTGNAKLAPLADYGGPTRTMLPLPGSPLIDAATGSTLIRDQRGLSRAGTPDLGAVEYQGNGDLAAAWNLDTDGDGIPFGVEFAVGSDLAVSDPAHPKNLTFSKNESGQSVLAFGRNPAANSTTTWRLTRSTTLLPGSFSEVFHYIGPTDDFFQQGSVVIMGSDFFQVIDTTPPPGGKVFYRFEAISP